MIGGRFCVVAVAFLCNNGARLKSSVLSSWCKVHKVVSCPYLRIE